MENKLKVSVIIPNYNYAKYLKKRVKVIEKQTYPIYELIILDDCSTDNSREVIEKLAKKYDIKMIFNEENSGCVFKQWQKGIEAATGDLIWIAEADDQADKKFLEKMVPCFNDKDVILAFADSKQINTRGRVIRKYGNKQAEVFYLIINNSVESKWFQNSHKTDRNFITIDEKGLEQVLRGEQPDLFRPKIGEIMFRF